MELLWGNIAWGAGAVVVLGGAGIAWSRIRKAALGRRSSAATDADREGEEARRRVQPEIDRVEAQKVAANSAARSALNGRPPL